MDIHRRINEPNDMGYDSVEEPLFSPLSSQPTPPQMRGTISSNSLSRSYVSIPDSEPEDFSDFLSKPKVQEVRLWRCFQTCFCILMVSLILFCIYTISLITKGVFPLPGDKKELLMALSNGTHAFEPTVILVSLDGFRADYLDRGLSPNLQRIIDGGTRAKYMNPSFPSITFPNHYTLVTGLYPDSHGIVGNSFYDPAWNRTFNYKSQQSNHEADWWGGEPIWITNEKHHKKSAVLMWPGSEVPHDNLKSTYLESFSLTVSAQEKAEQLLTWIDLPEAQRPSFLGAYIFDVDTAGHNHGPNSNATNLAIQKVDAAFGILLDGLEKRNLTEVVNVVVVSDHGMAEVLPENVIYLDDYLDMDLIASRHVYPFAGLTPKRPEDLDTIYHQLKLASANSSLWNVYKKDEIPARFHYGHNSRVPPIFCLQENGWSFATRQTYHHLDWLPDHLTGLHGYDNLHPDMRAIFLARGPAFPPHQPNLPPFFNIELYGLVSKILGLTPAPNNGTRSFMDQFSLP